MTQLGKFIITAGILIFTTSALIWIIQEDWRWIAAGAFVFIGAVLTSVIVSIETKPTTNGRLRQTTSPPPLASPLPTPPTPPPPEQDEWQPPSQPPPDEGQEEVEAEAEDPFLKPYPKQPNSPPI